MAVPFKLISHPRLSWLVRVQGRFYLVAPDLGRKLSRLQGLFDAEQIAGLLTPGEIVAVRAMLEGPAGDLRQASQKRWRRGDRSRGSQRLVWPRLPLLPSCLVNRVAGVLSSATTTPALWSLLAVGVAGYGLGYRSLMEPGSCQDPASLATTSDLGLAAGLFLLTALWHEMGHAAALRYEEYPPGSIGLGLLVFLPVLYCDVTPALALPRPGRLRVDAAGVVFQVAAGGLLFFTGSQLSVASFWLAGISALLSVAWSMLPFLRTDGYWLLCDLVGRPDLDSPLTAEELAPVSVTPLAGAAAGSASGDPVRSGNRRRGLAMGLIIYRLAHAVFLLVLAVWLPWRMWRWLPLRAWLTEEDSGLRWAAAALLGLLLILVLWFGHSLGKRLRALVTAAWQDGRVVMGRRRTEEGHHLTR